MTTATVMGLVNNAALLLALGILYDTLLFDLHREKKIFISQLSTGGFVGLLGIAVMMTPWEIFPGVVFDTRSVLLSISGLFFGGVPTLTAIAMTAAFRLYSGGTGMWTGVAVIITSGGIGLVWHLFRRKALDDLSIAELYLFGILVHVAMLLWMFSLPRPMAWAVLSGIGWPVLLIFPLGTVLLGRLLSVHQARKQDQEDRKKAEDQLRASESTVKSIMDNLPIGIAVNSVDPVVKFDYMNDNFCKYYRTTRAALAQPDGFWNSVYTDPDFRETIKDRILADCASGDPGRMYWADVPITRQGEKTAYITAQNIPLPEKQFMISVVWDVTKRKQAENALKESQRLLTEVGRISKIGGWEFDPQTLKGSWTDQVAEIHDMEPGKEISAEAGLSFYHGEHRKKIEQAFQKAIEFGEPYDLELELVTAKGNRKWIRTIGQPLKNGKKAVKIRGSIQDISDRRNAEEKYKRILENALMGVYQTTLGGKILFANQKMVDMFGYGSCEELQAHSIIELYARPEERAGVIKEILETGFIINEFEFRRKDGKSVWIRLHAQKSTTKEGEIILNGLIEDVTDFKKMEAQFQQAQKLEAIGTLSGGIAHDFNNILSSVIGFTELSMEDAEPGSPIHDNLTEILVAGKRAKDLVKQIMSFSRRDEQEKKPLQLNPLVREAAKMLRSTISSNIKITEHICETMLVITANPSQLNQVLLNLITNAAHAVDENGLIEIGIDTVTFDEDIIDQYPDRLPGAYAKIFVRDNGCGIEKEKLPLIFDPFFTTKAPDKGTGLGLSVVHGIVKLHNGHITVYSEPGRGTTFHVYLPLTNQLPPSESTRTAAQLPGGSEHILMVDDEPAIVNIQQQILERLGYTITTHTQSMDALNAFQAAPDSFDLIITDMTMPNMNGDRLILSIKKLRPDIPVILCTGFSEKINAKTSKDMLIDGFLMKPANKKEMATIIRTVLDAAQKNDPKAAFLP